MSEFVISQELAKYPNGAMFLFYAGRLQEMRGNLEQAVLKFEASIDSQSQWQQVGLGFFAFLGLEDNKVNKP